MRSRKSRDLTLVVEQREVPVRVLLRAVAAPRLHDESARRGAARVPIAVTVAEAIRPDGARALAQARALYQRLSAGVIAASVTLVRAATADGGAPGSELNGLDEAPGAAAIHHANAALKDGLAHAESRARGRLKLRDSEPRCRLPGDVAHPARVHLLEQLEGAVVDG